MEYFRHNICSLPLLLLFGILWSSFPHQIFEEVQIVTKLQILTTRMRFLNKQKKNKTKQNKKTKNVEAK